jgi:NTE family protein
MSRLSCREEDSGGSVATSTSSLAKTALILCGGGSKGAMEVGLYRALVELGVQIDFIVGTSIGALNGAFIAAGGTPDELESIWRSSLRPRELFPFNWEIVWKLKRADSLYSNAGVRAFLEHHLPVRRFEELRIPLYVTATRLQTGETVYVDHGDLIAPLLASIALPGIFPPIVRDGFQLMDGGLSDNVPIAFAASRGARRAIFMLCVCCSRESAAVHGFDRIVSQAASVMLDLKYRLDVQQFRDRLDLIALEPALGLDVSMLDFNHTDELIEGAYEIAMAELPSLLARSEKPEQAECATGGGIHGDDCPAPLRAENRVTKRRSAWRNGSR